MADGEQLWSSVAVRILSGGMRAKSASVNTVPRELMNCWPPLPFEVVSTGPTLPAKEQTKKGDGIFEYPIFPLACFLYLSFLPPQARKLNRDGDRFHTLSDLVQALATAMVHVATVCNHMDMMDKSKSISLLFTLPCSCSLLFQSGMCSGADGTQMQR